MTTVVFADLVGSTSMFERLGDETASRFVTQLVGALSQVFQQHGGRVVKLLGDGLFVVFSQEGDALAACVAIQKRLLDKPIRPGGSGAPVQMQMGMESGEVIEIDGDCFGDTVNSAARLADLAGAAQILTTHNVWSALGPVQRASLRSLGPMHLRGKAEAGLVYRVEWQTGRDDDATMMGRAMVTDVGPLVLELVAGAQAVQVNAGSARMSIGRGAGASLALNDPRVRCLQLWHLGLLRQPERSRGFAPHRVLPGRQRPDQRRVRTQGRQPLDQFFYPELTLRP